MKINLLSVGIISTIMIGSIAYAITVGVEPPASYINNLKTCTKSTITEKGNSIQEYTIKGMLPNGRCEVYISSYTNFADPKVYEGYKTMAHAFSQMANDMAKDKSKQITEADIPSQAQMIEQGKKEKDIIVCKFSNNERKALINAYQKHDSKNPPAKVENGNISYSFDISKVSSYDKLMMKLSGPCSTYDAEDISSANKEKKYACEYADTTCYWTDLGNGASSMSCTNEDKTISTFKLMDKVKQHVKAGMCQEI